MDFFLFIPRNQWGHDSIFMEFEYFSKMVHVIPYKKINDVIHIEELFLREVMRLHGLQKNIVSKQDTIFFGYFF